MNYDVILDNLKNKYLLVRAPKVDINCFLNTCKMGLLNKTQFIVLKKDLFEKDYGKPPLERIILAETKENILVKVKLNSHIDPSTKSCLFVPYTNSFTDIYDKYAQAFSLSFSDYGFTWYFIGINLF